MFSDESTFWLVRDDSKFVRRHSNVSPYDPRYTVKIVKQLDSVMSIHEAEYFMHDLALAYMSKAVKEFMGIYFDASYFSSIAASMPKRIRSLLKYKGNMSKY
ncbi:hypothetical protein E2C01_041838 [Portunus trituberculatus]|uniref:Uncharacterized protein n=1 Tax=Portunus trituberculatus TaxID=210409 RepID=A0A5B7FSR7_PORTR|nr:hypothetical protein [Portunus trituberculatus]